MFMKAIATACALALPGGCAGRAAAPALTPDHPAHPGAAAAPVPERSTTLAVDGVGAGPTSAPVGNAAPTTSAAEGPAVYVCPHHPEVTSDKPGQRCPKCGMQLVKRQATPAAGDPHGGHR